MAKIKPKDKTTVRHTLTGMEMELNTSRAEKLLETGNYERVKGSTRRAKPLVNPESALIKPPPEDILKKPSTSGSDDDGTDPAN